MSESVLRIVIDSRNAERNARNLSRELNSIERTGNHASNSMDSMSVATRKLAGYMMGLVTVGSAINKIDTYTNLQNKLKLVTNTQLELNTAMEDTHRIAMKTASDWAAVTDVYSKYMNNAKTLNLTQKDAAKLTEVTSKAVAISGSNTQAAAGALFQYGQALDGNILRAQEYNSLVDGAGGLLNAMATGLGVTRGELRQMMLDGKLTGEVITESLLKAGDSVDELYSKTQTTIKGSISLLSTQITKFTGEMSSSSGAAAGMADSIALLANNLETVADIAMLGGVAYLTKTIVAQTIATQGAITASIARRAADATVLQSQVQLAAVEVQRARQLTALALTEVNLARAEYNNATTRTARAAATMRLTQAEVAHRLALHQTTAATVAQAAAENTLNATRTRGAMLLGLVGGPIGAITLGVTALAAGYMYLSGKVEDSTDSLRTNNKSVEDAIKSYSELDSVKKRQQASSEKASLKELGEAYEDATDKLNTNAYALSRHNDTTREQAKEINGLISEFKQTGNLDLFSDKINKLSFISQDSKDKFNTLAGATKDAGTEFKNQKQFVDAITGSLNSTANAGRNAAAGVNDATNALSEYAKQARDVGRQAEITNKLLAKGYSQGVASDLAEVAAKNGKVTAQEAEAIIYKNKELTKLNATMEAQRKAQQAPVKAAKSLAAQQKKEAKELEAAQRERNELLRESQQILYEYGTEYARIEHDVTNEIKRISESALKSSDKSGLISEAKALGEARKKLYALELEENLYGWNWTEEQRLAKSFEIEKARIRSTKGATDQLKKIQIDAIDSQHRHELALIELAKEERIFQMQQGLMHANAQSEKYWNLERDRVNLNSKLTVDQKRREIELINELQAKEKFDNLSVAAKEWGSINAGMTGQGDQWQLQQEDDSRAKASEELLLAELDLANTAAQREAIWQAHHDRMSMIEADYQAKSIGLQANQAAQFAGIMQGMVSESSAAHSALGAIQKGAALFSTAMNSYTAISAAWASAPFPYNLPAVGMATMETGLLQAAVSALSPQGYANGGYTGAGGKYDVAGLVHKGEVVFSQDDVKRNGGVAAVESMRLSRDSNRVGNAQLNAINNGGVIQAKQQAQASASINSQPQVIDNKLSVVMVKDEDEAKDMLYSADGEKAFLYHMKRNRSKI